MDKQKEILKMSIKDKKIKYKCGHKSKGMIIVDANLLSMASYFVWVDGVGIFGTRELCWECWNKKRTDERDL